MHETHYHRQFWHNGITFCHPWPPPDTHEKKWHHLFLPTHHADTWHSCVYAFVSCKQWLGRWDRGGYKNKKTMKHTTQHDSTAPHSHQHHWHTTQLHVNVFVDCKVCRRWNRGGCKKYIKGEHLFRATYKRRVRILTSALQVKYKLDSQSLKVLVIEKIFLWESFLKAKVISFSNMTPLLHMSKLDEHCQH